MNNISIVTRLSLLCAFLLVVLIGSNLYLNNALSQGSDTLLEESKIVMTMTTANAASHAFGDLKYWLTDLAASLLIRSELQAEEARTRLEENLDLLESSDPVAVAAIRLDVERMVEHSLSAVNAYTDSQRVLGNTLMAKARTHILNVDVQLANLLTNLESTVQNNSERAIAQAKFAERISIILTISATLLGLLLTALVIHSIRTCLLYTSPSPRDKRQSRMPSSA